MDPTAFVFPTFSPEDGNRSSFWNAVFISEYETMDKVQKSSDSSCNKPSSEPFTTNPTTKVPSYAMFQGNF
jgi:hypothetical protein